jgi:hypothetical protein
MEREIPFDLSSLFGEKQGKQEAWPHPLSKKREETRPGAGTVRSRCPAMAAKHVGPDVDVPIFHRSEPPIDVASPLVLLAVRKYAVEKGRVGLVLPVMLELIKVRSIDDLGRSHTEISPTEARATSLRAPGPFTMASNRLAATIVAPARV